MAQTNEITLQVKIDRLRTATPEQVAKLQSIFANLGVSTKELASAFKNLGQALKSYDAAAKALPAHTNQRSKL